MNHSITWKNDDSVLPESNHLLPELWIDIFARLPVKTLLKIRCVCKSWCSVIDSSMFVYLHLDRYNNNRDKSHVLVKRGFSKRCMFYLHNIHDFNKIGFVHSTRDSYTLVGSCNGILLMRDTSSEGVENVMRLWNPSIRRSLLLPRPPYTYRQWVIMGFVPRTNDYKVVAFGNFKSITEVMSFAVYSLIDHRWRIENMTRVIRFVYAKRLQYGGGYVYLDGVAYWIGGSPNRPEYETHVVCFDFDVEEFSFVELPDAGEEVTGRIAFLLDESLAVLSVSSKKSCVWVMEKDRKGKETWRVWFSGDSNSEASDFISDCINNNVVILHVKNTDMIFVVLSGNAYYYNIRTQQLKQCEKTIRGLDSVCTYVESLVLH